MLSKIIFKWKAMSENFKNTTVLKNKYDKEGRLILREFRSIYTSKSGQDLELTQKIIILNNLNKFMIFSEINFTKFKGEE